MKTDKATAPAPKPGARRPRLTSLPRFTLYGEAPSTPGPALLHIESIVARSHLHDWEIDAHVHQGLHQVLWIHQGSVVAQLDENRSALRGPALLLVPPGVAHAFRFNPGCKGFVLTFNAGLLAEGEAATLGEALPQLLAEPCAMAMGGAQAEVERLQALFEMLHTESQAEDSADGPVPRWLACALVWQLARRVQRSQAQAARRGPAAERQSLYTRWLLLLEQNYLAHWPVSRYAERLGLSTERLNRMVRTETGQAAQALLHARLIREACRRLVHVAAPVSQLAFELGFSDPAYFCRFFKRHTGKTPREYRG
ncbi:helix-turn-helix domain-containing protein [Ideonella sp.]|uniref:helix-turn-helix domain-containing protein n=1 Tax=Ideonella sp. TaxID=1929293 RepID=UPI003BB782D4